MFTGIIQAIGHVESLQHQGGDVRLTVNAAGLELNSSNLGDSIAVNGVCLTAVEYTAQGFGADVSRETLKLTSLGSLKPGSPVNLEKALTLSTPLGGHLVSGHVDGLGVLLNMHDDGRSMRYQFQVPDDLARYIAAKGSITIDGTSLTVNQVDANQFGVNIVPHTWENTLFKHYQINTQVNIEVDIIARYLERLLAGHDAGSGDKQWLDRLTQAGFVSTDH